MSTTHKRTRTFTRDAARVAAASAIVVVALATAASAGAGKNKVHSLHHQTAEWMQGAEKAVSPAGTTTLRIGGTTDPTFTVYKLERPLRVVVDIANASLDGRLGRADGDKLTWSVNSWSVSQVLAHPIRGAGQSTVRFVIGLARPGTYRVNASGNDVVVEIAPRDPAPRRLNSARAAEAVAAARARAQRSQIAAERAKKAELRAVAQAREARAMAAAKDREIARTKAASSAEVEALRKLAAEAKSEAKRARMLTAQSQDEADRARRAARASDAAAGRARQVATASRAEAERAQKMAQQAKAESVRARAAAEKTRIELDRLHRSAAASHDELERARRAVRAARAEAARARSTADARSAEAERARLAAVKRAREAETSRKAAAGARADAERARLEAARRLARAEAIERKAAASQRDIEQLKNQLKKKNAEVAQALEAASARQAELERDQELTRRARIAAEKAQRGAAAARAEAEALREQSQRALEAAQSARKRAEGEISRLKSEASRARERAEAEVARLRAEAAAAAERAAAAVATARQEAEKVKALAQERVREADARTTEAAALMKRAEARLAQAKQAERLAEKAQNSADQSRKQAMEREQLAARAERAADERRAAARRAEAAARRYREQAGQSSDNRSTALALQKRAARAAREAEKRRAEAEAAVRKAELQRRKAEEMARGAEKRQAAALADLARAQKQREDAEKARDRANRQRDLAEAQRKEAQERRMSADASVREAKKRATRSRELLRREEVAYIEVARAQAQLSERANAAQVADARLAAVTAEMRAAEARAQSLRHATEQAERRARVLAGQKGASARDIQQARTRARGLATQRAQAEKEVRAHRAELASYRKKAAQLDKSHSNAEATLRQLTEAAGKARIAREREERALAELTERRAEAERKLAETERARAAAERARVAAEKAARQARAELAAARQGKQAIPAIHAEVRDVEFVDKKKVARVVIALSGPTTPRVLSSKGKRVVLHIPGVALPAALQRTLDTSRYRGPIKAISSYRDPKQRDGVRVVVNLNRPAKNALKRKGNTYYWDFAKRKNALAANAERPGATDKRGGTRTARARSFRPPIVSSYGAASTPITQKTIAQLSSRRHKVYRGTKIDLDFKDADIHNLLRLLADVGGVNIVIPDEIQARVTVRLRRVPWDQALEVILASKGLWYRREGNLYRIAPRKQLDAEDEAEAERRATLAKSEVPEPEIFTLNYAVAREIKTQIEPLLSPKGRIEVDSRTNALIINDIRGHRRRMVDLLTRLDTQTPQIQIEARIVEARSTFRREIGVQWGGSASASASGGNPTGLLFPNTVVARGGADDAQTVAAGTAVPSDFAVNLPAAVGSGKGGALGLSLGSVGGNFNINVRLSALEDSGSVRIISAPKITVVNNIQAQISQGVSIPISVISANGVQTQFVQADLSLKVTPHVSQRDCSIQMELEVTKNEADFSNTGARGDPSILRNEAKTTILVADGETTVLGGIYTRNTALNYSKVPFFGDLPLIGWFFKQRRENDERNEVLVFITPKITNKAFLRCE